MNWQAALRATQTVVGWTAGFVGVVVVFLALALFLSLVGAHPAWLLVIVLGGAWWTVLYRTYDNES